MLLFAQNIGPYPIWVVAVIAVLVIALIVLIVVRQMTKKG